MDFTEQGFKLKSGFILLRIGTKD